MSTNVNGSAASSSSDFVLLNGQEDPPAPVYSYEPLQTPPQATNVDPSGNGDQGYYHYNFPHQPPATHGVSQSGYGNVAASTLDADTLEFVSTEEHTSLGTAESGAIGDAAYTGSLDTEGHEQFDSRGKGGVTARLLDRHGFGWLMEVDEDEDEQQKPLL